MASWPILVTLHNVVNVPLSACDSGPRSFVVEAHMVHRVSAYSAPVAAATFTTDDVVSTTPGLLEVRLDEANRSGDRGGPKVWRCALPEFEVVVLVREHPRLPGGSASPFRPGRHVDGASELDGTRVVGTSAPLPLNAKAIVEVDKLTTRIVGTEMGQVGLSFTVDPADKAGYRHRLETFLRAHNPQGLRLVPSVVDVVSELDTFTKLYRRYSVQNYESRLAHFFDVYGPQYKSEIPSLLRQWEGREEELVRNLVLDNGPEVTTVDAAQRLTAYLAAYQLDRGAPEVQRLLETRAEGQVEGADAQTGLFAALVERYGPEPDPRTYLFMTPRYTPAAVVPVAGARGGAEERALFSSSPRHRGSPSLRRGGGPVDAGCAAPPKRSPPTPAPERPYLSVPVSPTPLPNGAAPQETARSLDRSPSFAVDDAHRTGVRKPARESAGKPAVTPRDNVVLSDAAARSGRQDAAAVRDASLWRKMCSMMQAQQRPLAPWREYQLFFLDEDEFTAAVRALRVFSDAPDGGEVRALVEEWLRRVDYALSTETLGSGDAYHGAAVQEAVRVTGLQPLHLQVVSVSSLFHREQYAGFSAYVQGRAKRAKTERLVLVGGVEKMMAVARFGLRAAAKHAGDRDGAAATASAASPDAGAAMRDGPLLFLREPFRRCVDRHSCALLICDVAVGATYVCPADMHAPPDPTADFLARYDSCVYTDEAAGPVVAVFAREQVMPRLVLQCVVDPQLHPCPAHPDRPVEYYVMESHVFACSRCVVVGAYKGKEVTPIEEAAVMARTGLAEVERTTNALKESMRAYTNQLHNEEIGVPTAPRRLEAEREVERLQRETAERIRQIRQRVEAEDEVQLARIAAERAEAHAALEAADLLGERLASAMQQRAPVAAVNALQRIQQEGQVEQLMARVRERVPLAPLELVLPLDGPPPPATKSPGSSTLAGTSHRSPAVVAGLNESVLPSDRASRASRPAALRSSQPPPGHPTAASTSPASDLYAQYLAVAGAAGRGGRAPGVRGASRAEQPSLEHSGWALARSSQSAPAGGGSDGDGREEVSGLSAKEALARGWALLRRRDVAAAQHVWAAVCRTHGTDDVLGTKARAYMAEAIEKDYTAAAQWYARSLQLDPQDRMTAYNYGVLLEALLDKPQEALRLYDRAASLGDAVAAARAQELRSTLPAAAAAAPR
ncbi:hypothetical protein NESM_000758200 [Novymonas esmeraldas]|uniref:Uncharacterized protein n=1 Tax=Novymonas esmeraldas TaxID=1808958 RepID=A0AAW0EYA8_9TRYP